MTKQISVVLAVIATVSLGASSPPNLISKAQARELVLKFMRSQGYKTSSPRFQLEETKDPSFPDFYIFEARVDNADRFDAAGEYVVDPRTADLQEMNTCVPPKSATVLKFQAALRKSIGLSASEYGKAAQQHPLPCYK